MLATEKPTCFAIAPIGPNDSDVRRRSDKVLKHIFKKALSEKYEVIRGDNIDEPGMITSQVLRAVQDSPLVVADLTGHNPNVLYELAVRHAIEKPIIHVIEPKLSKIPFDIAGFRTIEFDLTDPDSIESAVEQLQKQTEQAEKGKWGETPVKLANIMQRSKEDSQESLLLKEAVQGIAGLRAHFVQMADAITELESGFSYVRNVMTPAASLSPAWSEVLGSGAQSGKSTHTLRDLDAGPGKGLRAAAKNALRERLKPTTPEDRREEDK